MTAPRRPPSGRWVRRTTLRVQDARSGRGAGSVLLEVWAAVTVLAVQGAVLGSAVVLLGEGAVPGLGGPLATRAGDIAGACAGLALLGALLGVAARLGPVGLSRAGATWWLPLPVDRRGLLRPTVLGWPGAAAVAGGLVTPLAVVALGGGPEVRTVVGWAAVGATAAAAVVATAGAAQTTDGAVVSGRRLAVAGDVLLVAGASGTALTVTWSRPWHLGDAWPVPAGALLLVAAALVVVTDRRAEAVDGALLRGRAGVGDRVRGAVLGLDLRELSAALTGPSTAVRRRSWRLRPGGARRAVVLADFVLVARAPRALVQVGVASVLGLAAGEVLPSGLLLHVTWVVTGFWAASAVAGGARHNDLVPALERLLPLSRTVTRAAHGVVPLLGALVWAAVVLGAQAWRSGDAWWSVLVPAWAVVMAAAAVRAAFRPPSRFLAATVSTPMGGVPSTGGLLQGVDVAVAGTLPTAFALLVGRPPAVVAAVQAVVAALTVVGVVRYVGRSTG